MKKENMNKLINELQQDFKPFKAIKKNSFIKVGAVVVKTKLPIFFEDHEITPVDSSETFMITRHEPKIFKINRFNTDVLFYDYQVEPTQYGFKK